MKEIAKEKVKRAKSSKKGSGRTAEYIANRVIEIANYMVETDATIRQTAKKFGISKSTVHMDCRKRLPICGGEKLTAAVNDVISRNNGDKAKRGGEATKRKYERLRGER